MARKKDEDSAVSLSNLFSQMRGYEENTDIEEIQLEFPDEPEDEDLDIELDFGEEDTEEEGVLIPREFYRDREPDRSDVYHDDYRHFDNLTEEDEEVWVDSSIWMLEDKDQENLINHIGFADESATDFTSIAYDALIPEYQPYARAMAYFGRKHVGNKLYLDRSFEKFAIPFLLRLQNLGFEKRSMYEGMEFLVEMMNKNADKHRRAFENELQYDMNELLVKMAAEAKHIS